MKSNFGCSSKWGPKLTRGISFVAFILMLMIRSQASIAIETAQASSARIVQGQFASPSDQVSFQQTLSKTINQTVKITNPSDGTTNGDGAIDDQLGYSVALSGNTALIGAYRDDTLAGVNAGSAYVFVREGNAWLFQTKLSAADGAAFDEFGYSVALYGDTALIGAFKANTSVGMDSGAAYVFVRNGIAWSQQQKLIPDSDKASINFGVSVALNGETALVNALFATPSSSQTVGSVYVFSRNGSAWSLQDTLFTGEAIDQGQFGVRIALSEDTALIGAENEESPIGIFAGVVYVFSRTGNDWNLQATLIPSDGAFFDFFGTSVALEGDTALVSASGSDTPVGLNTGAVYVFTRKGITWSEQAKLIPRSGTSSVDDFGNSVSLSGDTALIGAFKENFGVGSAYVFVRNDGSWIEQAKLIASDQASGDRFGISVAVSGNTALIGAYLDDLAPGRDVGSSYVFTRNSSAWGQETKLTSGNGIEGDGFGFPIAIAGNTAMVGAPFDDTPSGNDIGSVYVFSRVGSKWLLRETLNSNDGATGDLFGYSLAISNDTALVGALKDDVPIGIDLGLDLGSVYVFAFSNGTWRQQVKLNSPNRQSNSNFGMALALSGDFAVVGASRANEPIGTAGGAAYVFQRVADSWGQPHLLVPSGLGNAGGFGSSVEIEGDTALVGSPGFYSEANGRAGAAYVFVLANGQWSQQAILTADDGEESDGFGSSVAIDDDTALVGAIGDDSSRGSAYVFIRNGNNWIQQAKLMADSRVEEDFFANSVAISGDSAIVSAPYVDIPNVPDIGSVYVFTRNGETWMQSAKLTANDGAYQDHFGASIAYSDGVLMGGATGDDSAITGNQDLGSVYVFDSSTLFSNSFE